MKKRKKQVVSIVLSVCMFLAMLPAEALAMEGDVPYRYWDESAGSFQDGTAPFGTYTEVQGSDVDWGADGQENWYVVRGEVSINNSVPGSGLTDTLFVRGTVHLILMDGSTLNCGRIVTRAGSRLHIYAQSDTDGMGKVAASGGIGADDSADVDAGVAIHGGNVEARSGGVPAIGSDYGGYTVTAYGGVITAVNEKGGAGIWADDVNLQGCSVNVHSTGHNGIYGEKSITLSDGEITVRSDTANGIYSPGNVTVSGGIVNVDAGNGTDNTCGILAGGVFEAKEQARVIVDNKGNAAAIEGAQGVVISGSEVSSISAHSNGIWTGNDIKITDGANVTAEGANPALWTRNGIEINGSKVTLSGKSDGIWTPDGSISIRNSSEVKVTVSGGALAAGGGNITVSGSTAELSSENANGIYAGAGAIEIVDGSNVTASGKNSALFGKTQITVSGSKVNAVSAQDVGVYSPGTAVLTDSVVTASGGSGGILIGTKDGSAVSGSWVDGTYGDSFAAVENTMSVGEGIAVVTGNAVVPQGVTLPRGTTITIPEGGSLKINDEVTITSFPAGQQATVGEDGNIDLPAGTVVSVAGEQVTVPAEGGSVNFGGEVNIYAVSLDQASLTIPFGETAVLSATVKPAGAEIIWSSDKEDIATVADGVVTARGEGKAAITARVGNVSAVCQITVGHNWSGEWSSNATHHWHNCAAAGSCTITENAGKEGYGEHSPGEWIVDRGPTAEEDGSRHKECIECGFITETEVIPGDSGATPTPEPTASPAPTAEPTASPAPTAEPTASPVPTAEPTASPEPTAEPTASPAPTAEPTASPAPTGEPAPEPAHSHSWSKEWKSNSGYHWRDCVAEGCNVTENSKKAGYGEHIPGEWITDSEPTAEAGGRRHRQCVVCGFVTEAAEIPATGSQKGDPFIRNDAGEKGWEAVKAAAEKAAQNSTVDIVMNGAVLVPGEILDAAKGRDITLVFDMGDGVAWIVNGKQITADKVGDIDLSVKKDSGGIPEDMARNVAAGNAYRQFSLTHNGDFGFTATLFLNLGKENQGCEAVLYYYNRETGRPETVGRSRISENGTAGFAFTHASDYMVVIERRGDNDSAGDNGQENNGSDTGGGTALASPATGDIQFIWLAVYGLAAILAGIGFLFMARRGRHRS